MYGGFQRLLDGDSVTKKWIIPHRNLSLISLRIVNHFSNPGDLVVVPFAGSGTECLAAIMCERHYLGYELNPDYITIARKRLKDWSTCPKQLTLDSL